MLLPGICDKTSSSSRDFISIREERVRRFKEAKEHGEKRFLDLKQADHRLHMYVLGKTGSGKSTLIKNLVAQDIQHGHGIRVIDAHGNLIKDILNLFPTERTNDIVYFDPADHDHPIGFNILEKEGIFTCTLMNVKTYRRKYLPLFCLN